MNKPKKKPGSTGKTKENRVVPLTVGDCLHILELSKGWPALAIHGAPIEAELLRARHELLLAVTAWLTKMAKAE